MKFPLPFFILCFVAFLAYLPITIRGIEQEKKAEQPAKQEKAQPKPADAPTIAVPADTSLKYQPVPVPISIAYSGTGKVSVLWQITPAMPAASKTASTPTGFSYIGPPGTFQIGAVVVDWQGQQLYQVDPVTVMFTAAPGPGPGPGPQPDPLQVAIQAAYATDPDPQKVPMVTALAKVYAYGASVAKDYTTIGMLYQAMGTYATSQSITGNNIKTVQQVLQAELLSKLPNPVTNPNSSYDPAMVAAEFTRISNYLQTVKSKGGK